MKSYKTYCIFIFFFLNTTLMQGQEIDIINIEKQIGNNNWSIVNDNVMGGISESNLSINDKNNLIFNGSVSLENNGGFASSRLSIKKGSLKKIKGFKIKFIGDGKTYKLRLRQSNRRVSYSTDFVTIQGKGLEIEIPLEDLKPMWRGYYYDSPLLEIENINSIGFQISDKQEGFFELEIKFVKGVY